MSIFISYSHSDKAAVNKLAALLVKANTHVWVDFWELSVGDSILNRVQDAITECSALLIVLSKTSVKSEWCRKELNAGLMRELEEKRVVVLPVLIEDCEIPLFLREKMYADLRADYKSGVSSILEAIAKVTNASQSRFETDDDSHVDWSVDWYESDDARLALQYTLVETFEKMKLTLLTEIRVVCNKVTSARYYQYKSIGLDWMFRVIVAEDLYDFGSRDNFHVILEDQRPQIFSGVMAFKDTGGGYDVTVTCRRLGEDNGKNQVVHVSNYLKRIRDYSSICFAQTDQGRNVSAKGDCHFSKVAQSYEVEMTA